VARNTVLKNKYRMVVKQRVKYLKMFIRYLGYLVRYYFRICEKRYQFGGRGYVDARWNFNQKLI